MRKLPSTLPPDLRDDCQQVLVEQGHLTEPEPFARFARQVLLACDPDGNHDDRDPTEKVDLTIGPRNHDNGITPFRGHLDDDGVELLHQALKGLTNPHPTDTGTPDPRTPATRRGQALKEVLRRYLDIADTPTTGGERPHITLTMSYQDLKNALRHGTLDYGGPITPATARRLACDATIIPAVLGGPSEILDIGRATRTWPTAIRRAATLRDQGCAWPGCDRPPAWTDIHHIRHWANGGPTSLTNAVLLCRRHHHTIHDGHWHITLATDGTPEFTAPTWIDPTQTPRRNYHHHLPDHLRPDRN